MRQIEKKSLYQGVTTITFLLLLVLANFTSAQTNATAVSRYKSVTGVSATGRSEPGNHVNITALPEIARDPNVQYPFAPASTCVNLKLLWAPADQDDPAIRASISAVTGGAVDYFDSRAGVPTLSLLQSYDAVYTFADFTYSNATNFGNILATYVDGGGIVIMGSFTTVQPWGLLGTITTSAYSPVTNPTNTNTYLGNSYALNGTGPLYTGVTNLGSTYRDHVTLQGSGISNGSYSDGVILAAYRPDYKVVYLGGAIEPLIDPGMTGDWPRLIANAMLLGCQGSPCSNPTSGGTIAADQSVCAGYAAAAFTSIADPAGFSGTLEYKWEVSTTGSSSGFTDIPSSNSNVYAPGTPLQTSWYKRVARVACKSDWAGAAESNVVQVLINPLPAPTLAGPTPVCINSTGNVYTTEASMTGYTWTVSAGGTITAGGTGANNTVTVTWNTLGAQSVSVNYTNANGCTAAAPTVYNVTVNALPAPTLAGPTPVCVNSTGNVYTTQAGMTGYSWTVSAGGTITAGGTGANNTVTVTWNTVGAQSVSVNYTNANGCTAAAPTVYNVTVNALPAPTLAGPTPVCVNSTGNVYTTQAGMTGYSWTVSAGGTITAGGTGTSNTVTVTWNTVGAQSVSVNYTNANGCTAAAPTVYNVTVNALPAPTLAGPTPVCVNSSGNVYTTQAGMTGYSWTVSAGGTITAGGTGTSNTVTVTWNTVGAQSVSVNYTNANGCTAAAPTVYNVTVNALPAPTLAGPTPVCVNSTGNVYTTQAGMTGYSWTVSAGGTITAGGTGTSNTVTVTWNTVGGQSVSVNYTNANGCTAAAASVYNVTVNALPVPTLAGPTPVCVNSTGNVYTTQAGMTGYSWTVSAGGTITAGGTGASNTVTVTWNTVGGQSVSVNYTNANGCTAAAPTVYNVTVNALPVPTLAGPTPVCVNSTVNVYTTQAGMTGYSWTVSAGGTITAGGTGASNTVTVTWNTVGGQSVSVNYTNANGCTAAAPTVYNVTVNALPVPTLAGPTPVCVNSTGNIYTTQAGMTGYSWTVSAGGTITAGGTGASNTVTVTWNTVGAQSVSVNYTNANGCTAAAPTVYNVTVNALPVPTLAGPTPVCVNSTGNIYTTQAGMTGYSWTVSAGGTITAGGTGASNTVTVTWNTVGAQSVSVNYTNANGCTAAAPTVYNVTVNALPVPTLAGPTPVCVNSTGNIYTTQAGMTGYSWTVSAGGTITAGGTGASNTVTVTWNTVGAQSVSVNYTNANGCTAAAPTVYNVTVNALPVPTLAGPTPVCVNSSGNVYTTQAGMTGYSWTVSAGGTITAGGTGASNTVTVTWNTVGAQSVSVNYTNANGCTAAAATVYNVTVNALPVPTLAGPTPVCVNSSGNVYTTQAGMTGYSWTVSAGGTITAGGTGASNTVTVTWNTVGAQSVSVNYTNANGCTAAAATVYNVTVNALPVPTLAGPTPVCVNSSGNVYTTQAGMTGYSWTVSAGGTITAGGTGTSNTVTVTWNTVGAQSVSVNYTNANGCTAAAATVYNVTVNALPVPTITGSTNLCANSGYYNYTTEAGMTNYTWNVSPGGSIIFGSGTNQIQVSWVAAGTQTVSVTYNNGFGCSAVVPALLTVTVNPEPGPAGTITGTANLCAGTNSVSYSVAVIPNTTTYVWTLPADATIVSGMGTNSILVDFGISSTSGNMTVYGNNLCGNGTPSPAYPVTVNAIPATPVVTATGDTLSSSAPAGNQWYFNGNILPGATAQTYVAQQPGWYWSVVALNGCASDTSNHLHIINVGVGPSPNAADISTYPNPNDGLFTLTITTVKAEKFTIRVFNNLGYRIFEMKDAVDTGTTGMLLDLRPVSNGLYTLIISNEQGSVVKKIIVNK